MAFLSWQRNAKSFPARRTTSPPRLEALEDRCLLSLGAPVAYPVSAAPQTVVTADLNGDGKPDLVAACGSQVSVLLGNGNGTFAAARNYAATLCPYASPAVAVADFNGDGKPDLVTCGSLLIGNGDGTFKAALAINGGYGPVAVGDFNGDGKADLATTVNGGDWYTTDVHVLLGNGKKNVAFTDVGYYSVPQYSGIPSALAVGDVNHDGSQDIVVTGDAGWGSSYVSVLPGNGKGGFQTAQSNYVGSYPTAVAFGDVNGDAQADLVTAYANGTVSAAGRIWTVGRSPTAVAVADINGDGKRDIVTANAGNGTVSVLLGNGDSTFAAAINYPAVSSYSNATLTVGDFNRDGKPDLAVAGDVNSAVSVMLNAADWATSDHFAVSGFPSPTTAGVSGSVTVSARKADGSTDTGYTGTVHFVSTDFQDAPPADYTFTATDQGTHTFTTTPTRAGTWTLWATDMQAKATPGAESITVQPAAPSRLGIIGYPSPADYGTTATVKVEAADPYANLVTSYNGTVHFTSSDPLAVLPADAALSNGVGYFSATLKTAGTQSITATDMANPTLTGGQQNIQVRPVAQIAGPAVAAEGETVTFTLSAAGTPAGALCTFNIDWFDGTTQTVTGPNGTTATHVYNNIGYWEITVTASYNGATSQPTHDYVGMQDIPITVQADPAAPGKQMLIVDGSNTSNWNTPDGIILWGYLNLALSTAANNGVTVTLDGQSLGTFTTSDGSPFALVIVRGCQNGNTIDARGLSVSTALVGGYSGDILHGGSGRNLLIGGSSSDNLYAGSAGDILIGGTTSYDTDPTALAYLMAEWNRTDVDYATRLGHLNGSITGGLNASYLLNTKSVFDDSAADVLYGGAGQDWFIAHLSGAGTLDQVNGQTSGEVATSI